MALLAFLIISALVCIAVSVVHSFRQSATALRQNRTDTGTDLTGLRGLRWFGSVVAYTYRAGSQRTQSL
jgi:hypothetical protein